jgi:hypothetical protein
MYVHWRMPDRDGSVLESGTWWKIVDEGASAWWICGSVAGRCWLGQSGSISAVWHVAEAIESASSCSSRIISS